MEMTEAQMRSPLIVRFYSQPNSINGILISSIPTSAKSMNAYLKLLQAGDHPPFSRRHNLDARCGWHSEARPIPLSGYGRRCGDERSAAEEVQFHFLLSLYLQEGAPLEFPIGNSSIYSQLTGHNKSISILSTIHAKFVELKRNIPFSLTEGTAADEFTPEFDFSIDANFEVGRRIYVFFPSVFLWHIVGQTRLESHRNDARRQSRFLFAGVGVVGGGGRRRFRPPQVFDRLSPAQIRGEW